MKKSKEMPKKGDIKKGFEKPTWSKKEELDDSPLNSNWRDLDDGGFLGRAKGQER